MAIALGAHDHKQNTTTGTTLTTAGVTTTGGAGSVFYAFINWGAGATFSTITDSKSNAWTLVDVQGTFVYGADTRVYECVGGTGGAAHTITATIGAIEFLTAYFVEILGATTSSPRDQTVTWNDDVATPFTSGISGTTSQANELVLAFANTNTPSGTETITWGNSFLPVDNDGNSSFVTAAVGYKIVASTGTQQSSFTSSVATEAATLILTIKEAIAVGDTLMSQICL